jgi:hypothetical protein
VQDCVVEAVFFKIRCLNNDVVVFTVFDLSRAYEAVEVRSAIDGLGIDSNPAVVVYLNAFYSNVFSGGSLCLCVHRYVLCRGWCGEKQKARGNSGD